MIKKNQLTEIFEKFPQYENLKGYELEIMLEDYLNGSEAGFQVFQRRIRNDLSKVRVDNAKKKSDKLREKLKKSDLLSE